MSTVSGVEVLHRAPNKTKGIFKHLINCDCRQSGVFVGKVSDQDMFPLFSSVRQKLYVLQLWRNWFSGQTAQSLLPCAIVIQPTLLSGAQIISSFSFAFDIAASKNCRLVVRFCRMLLMPSQVSIALKTRTTRFKTHIKQINLNNFLIGKAWLSLLVVLLFSSSSVILVLLCVCVFFIFGHV